VEAYIRDALQKCPLFHGCTPEEAVSLAKDCHAALVSFESGESIPLKGNDGGEIVGLNRPYQQSGGYEAFDAFVGKQDNSTVGRQLTLYTVDRQIYVKCSRSFRKNMIIIEFFHIISVLPLKFLYLIFEITQYIPN